MLPLRLPPFGKDCAIAVEVSADATRIVAIRVIVRLLLALRVGGLSSRIALVTSAVVWVLVPSSLIFIIRWLGSGMYGDTAARQRRDWSSRRETPIGQAIQALVHESQVSSVAGEPLVLRLYYP
jgi:hypothetical protein